MPWEWVAGGTNTNYQFGIQDGTTHVSVFTKLSAGDSITLKYVSGTVKYDPAFASVNAGGNSGATGSSIDVGTGTGYPTRYCPGTALTGANGNGSGGGLGLAGAIGVFTDASGNIVSVVAIGLGGTFTVPAGATAFQVGINDDKFVDNTGSFVFSATHTSGQASYDKGDFVVSSGNLYQAIADNPAGVTPPNTTYWKLIPLSGALDDLSDVTITSPVDGNTIQYDSASGLWLNKTGTFKGLSDTPSTYTGQAGKFTRVNAGETALEFAAVSGGGGGNITPGEAHPLTPNANDDEFEGSVLDPSWTRWAANTGTLAITPVSEQSVIKMQNTAPVDPRWNLILKNAPSSSFDVVAHFSMAKQVTVSTDGYAGLVLMPATDGQMEALCIGSDGIAVPIARWERWTNRSTFGSQVAAPNGDSTGIANGVGQGLSGQLFARWNVNGTTVSAYISIDGLAWGLIATNILPFTPGRVGLGIRGQSTGIFGYFDFVRFNYVP